jgi:septal ring factor EnvC (AmiA/AmiB activator)
LNIERPLYLQILQSQLAAAREQQTILQSALNKQQHAGDLVSKLQENAAATLTTQLEDATQALADLKAKVANLKADLRTAKDALSSAEMATSRETDEEVMRLNVIIGDLEATIAENSKHAGDILRRYKLGQLVGRHQPPYCSGSSDLADNFAVRPRARACGVHHGASTEHP